MFISTDKVVKPVGIMGMIKRVAGGLLLSLNGGPTTYGAVRFGNGLGNDGSVLPLFRWQIAQGGPVTDQQPKAQGLPLRPPPPIRRLFGLLAGDLRRIAQDKGGFFIKEAEEHLLGLSRLEKPLNRLIVGLWLPRHGLSDVSSRTLLRWASGGIIRRDW